MKTTTLRFPIPREIILNSNQVVFRRVKGLRVKTLRQMGEALGLAINENKFDKYTVDVIVYPPSKRRLDPPNLYPTVKPLIDGLTDANLWEDDDHEHMSSMTFYYGDLSQLPDMFLIDFIIKEVKK